MSRRTSAITLMVLGILFVAGLVVAGTPAESVTAQFVTDTPTPTPTNTPTPQATRTCEREQCLGYVCQDGNCGWLTPCLTPPFDICDSTTEVTVRAVECEDDLYAVRAYLYDDTETCISTGSGTGLLGGGALSEDEDVWSRTFELEEGTVPDRIMFCWVGATPNYWTEGISEFNVSWACVQGGP